MDSCNPIFLPANPLIQEISALIIFHPHLFTALMENVSTLLFETNLKNVFDKIHKGPKDGGTEANLEVESSFSSLFSSLLHPTVVTTDMTTDSFFTTKKNKRNQKKQKTWTMSSLPT